MCFAADCKLRNKGNTRPQNGSQSGDDSPLTFDFPLLSYYRVAMEPLHAPWRIEYILSPKPAADESLFTRIAQSSDDEANYVIARNRTCFALLNRYPYTGGHLMTVPYKQTCDFDG